MNAYVITSTSITERPAIAQHADLGFPSVLVFGMTGAVIALGATWLTALAFA